MRFLVDAQLPPALVQFLIKSGNEAEHVFELGLVDWSKSLRHSRLYQQRDDRVVEGTALEKRQG